MLTTATLLLATSLLVPPAGPSGPPKRIDVDCSVDGALERALTRAQRSKVGVDIFLHGICEGGVVIATDGVALRGATPDAGLVAPDPPADIQILVEIVGAQVYMRDLTLRGGDIGILADGQDAEAVLFNLELSDQSIGAYARNGAEMRILDSTVRDGDVGVLAQFDVLVVLQNTIVTGQDTGIAIFDRSRAGITNTTVENSRTGGLQLEGRCDAVIFGGTFRENSQVHIFAGGRSDITLLDNVVVGSETDTTQGALAVNEHSSITSFTTPEIHGDLHALDRGSLRIGNARVEGSLLVSTFSDALVKDAEIVEGVYCRTGSDVICSGSSTTPSVVDCPSTTCGEPSPASPSSNAPVEGLILRRPTIPTR